MRIWSIIVLPFLYLSTFAQEAEFKGYIEDQASLLPLHGAHIQNLTSQKLVVSAPNGTFSLPASIGDSVLITYTGFAAQSIVISEKHLETRSFLSLEPTEVYLQDVVVTPFPEYAQFKQLILETEPVDSSVHFDIPKAGKYAFYDPRTASLDGDLGAPAVRVPFDLERLTKKGKEKKKLLEMLEAEQKWKRANQKFNREWVAELTALEGDELTSFIAYCNFSADYIIETHLIELKQEVLVLLAEFQSEETKNEQDRYTPGA